MLVATNRKRRVEKMVWPKRPRLSRHHSLGRRQTWESGRYRIDRFPDLGKPYYCATRQDDNGWSLVSSHRRLLAAQKACQADANARGADGR